MCSAAPARAGRGELEDGDGGPALDDGIGVGEVLLEGGQRGEAGGDGFESGSSGFAGDHGGQPYRVAARIQGVGRA